MKRILQCQFARVVVLFLVVVSAHAMWLSHPQMSVLESSESTTTTFNFNPWQTPSRRNAPQSPFTPQITLQPPTQPSVLPSPALSQRLSSQSMSTFLKPPWRQISLDGKARRGDHPVMEATDLTTSPTALPTNPTSRPTLVPFPQPTARPSILPHTMTSSPTLRVALTSSPTTASCDKAYMTVSQLLGNATPSALLASSCHALVWAATVSLSTTDIGPPQVSINNITSQAPLATTEVIYTITFCADATSAGVMSSFNALAAQLRSAVASGSFTLTLSSAAATYDCPALAHALATAPPNITGPIIVSTVQQPPLSSAGAPLTPGGIAGVVLSLASFLAFSIASYRYWLAEHKKHHQHVQFDPSEVRESAEEEVRAKKRRESKMAQQAEQEHRDDWGRPSARTSLQSTHRFSEGPDATTAVLATTKDRTGKEGGVNDAATAVETTNPTSKEEGAAGDGGREGLGLAARTLRRLSSLMMPSQPRTATPETGKDDVVGRPSQVPMDRAYVHSDAAVAGNNEAFGLVKTPSPPLLIAASVSASPLDSSSSMKRTSNIRLALARRASASSASSALPGAPISIRSLAKTPPPVVQECVASDHSEPQKGGREEGSGDASVTALQAKTDEI